MVGIYKITNPTGKIYIGQSINISRRFNEYYKLQCNQSLKLYYSLKKYGPENHKFEIIEECNVRELNEREEYYILYFQSNVIGLNIKLGSKPTWTGKKRPEHSVFMKKQNFLKYPRTEKHITDLSKMMENIWKNPQRKKEISNKISKNKIGKGTKKIQCIETKEIYSSIKECSEKMNISKGCLCSFIKGKYPYPTLKGYTFKYF